MATCAECVHVEVCKMHYRQKCELTYESKREVEIAMRKAQKAVDIECDYYKDRSRFVELPCKVGDTVYFNNVHLRYAKVIAIYIDASGGMFDLDIATNIETVAGYEHFINKDYTFEDVGRRLFLTSEEAERALKGCECNGQSEN